MSFSKQRFFQYCIVEFMRFLKHDGFTRSAAMSLKYGGIYNNHFVANFVLSLAVK